MGRGSKPGSGAEATAVVSARGWVESRIGWVDSLVLPAATAVACLTPGRDETRGRALAVPGGGGARGVGGGQRRGPAALHETRPLGSGAPHL